MVKTGNLESVLGILEHHLEPYKNKDLFNDMKKREFAIRFGGMCIDAQTALLVAKKIYEKCLDVEIEGREKIKGIHFIEIESDLIKPLEAVRDYIDPEKLASMPVKDALKINSLAYASMNSINKYMENLSKKINEGESEGLKEILKEKLYFDNLYFYYPEEVTKK